MSARGFKSVGWVAAVGTAALGCYMLSLRVATERNDLARVERQIVAAKQDIRSLQTELGTLGRLSQLERWNADVLALSAPISGQFLQDEFTLARFDQREKSFEERTQVRMASADTAAPEPAARISPPAATVRMAAAPAEDAPQAATQLALVHRAGFTPSPAKPAPAVGQATAPVRQAALIDAKLAAELGAAARAEKTERRGGTE